MDLHPLVTFELQHLLVRTSENVQRRVSGLTAGLLGLAALALVHAPGSVQAATGPTTYAKAYRNVVNNIAYDASPADVKATLDGGSVVLGLTQAPAGPGVSWLMKLDSLGNPKWQREVGCFKTPPGSYADAVSVQPTTDGGYAIGGGTVGCGSQSICPALSGIQCAVLEKLDSTGNLLWARVYEAGQASSGFNSIRQTADGGYIAAGSTTNVHQNTGALVIKLDGLGGVQWRRQLGPSGSTQAYLDAVIQTSDGGFVATGDYHVPSASAPRTNVLVVRLDRLGNLLWQRGLGGVDSTGSPNAVAQSMSIVQTSDGGFAAAGTWTNSFLPGQCCAGALLVKLDSTGRIQWQRAYSGGVYCYSNGFSETCTTIDGVVYSVHQTAGGGYLLAGDARLELSDSAPIEPWLAGVDAAGNLLWQYLYYQVYKPTGRPLSEYFASSAPSIDGGLVATGFTENYQLQKGEIFGVKTDSAGLAGSCSDVHPATPLNAIDPGLSPLAPSLALTSAAVPAATSTSKSAATSVVVQTDC
ncbi:MAG: hypothetical protein M3082_00285 [Candidatus Dormibacteraeota bacterium]|nr:hypothetical protein [Candidatus Dormibacteraeota bacterium]